MRGRVLPAAFVCVLVSATGSHASAVPALAAVPPTIGVVPQDCPGSTHFVSLYNLFDDGKSYGGYIGSTPVWLAGFSGPPATLLSPYVYEPGYGWGRKMLFVLKRGFSGTVTLHGGSVRGHAPIWFDAVSVDAPDGPVRRMTLQAKNQKAFAGGAGPRPWPSFPGGITVPRAGCYYVEATWPGGRWRITFAAGS